MVSLRSTAPLEARKRLLDGQRGSKELKRLRQLLDKETVRAAGDTTATMKPEWLAAPWLEGEARSPFCPSIRVTVNLFVHRLEPQSSMTLNHLLPQCSALETLHRMRATVQGGLDWLSLS